jgi:trehalose-6-phosphate synthase
MVNPHDIDGMAEAIFHAYHMDLEDRKTRMSRMRRMIQRRDVFEWVNSFLRAGISRDLSDFPPIEDYMPPIK